MTRQSCKGYAGVATGISLQLAACVSLDAAPESVDLAELPLAASSKAGSAHDVDPPGHRRAHSPHSKGVRRHHPARGRPCDAGDPDVVDAAVPQEQTPLPPWLRYCTDAAPCATDVRLTTCPPDTVGCAQTGRETTLRWTIDGAPVDGVTVFVNTHAGAVAVASNSPRVTSFGPFAAVQGASSLALIEGQGTTVEGLSYYNVTPRWGGVTELGFTSLTLAGPHGTAWFFRHSSFDFGLTAEALRDAVEQVYDGVVALSGRTPPAYRAFFIPSELVVNNGDGNFAFWPDTVTINYGNPDWLSYLGGFQTSVQWEWAHELTHLLTQPLGERLSNIACLNEGLADAVGNKLGYIPESDFRPGDSTLESSCRGLVGLHAIGNCYLWHLKHYRADTVTDGPFWTERTFAGLFATPRALRLDTCSVPWPGQQAPSAEDLVTGDSWVVYFSDATGEDMTEFVQSLGFFSSGSLGASIAALGL